MILVTGAGRSGSWQVRGEQLGRAIGAVVKPLADLADCRGADLVVIVKRPPAATLDAVRRSGMPWVWDVVDAWPQGHHPDMDERQAKRWLRAQLEALQPTAVVWPTWRMQDDARWEGPQIALPHHGWPKYHRREVSDTIRAVGYEGGNYLGRWRQVLEQECALRGWQFVVNGDMQQVDVGVALRDGGGYPAAHWKSNCKLANLQHLGIPAICSPECGYMETQCGSELWASCAAELAAAFRELENDKRRRELAAAARPIPLDQVAKTYRGWLDECVRG